MGPPGQDRVPVGRSEQYVPTMLYFGLFSNFVDMIVAAKIAIVVIWMGAGFSQLQHGFSATVAIMVQNTPWMVSPVPQGDGQGLPERHPAIEVTHALAHIGGTTCELVMPLVLLFSPWTVADLGGDHLDLDAPHLHHRPSRWRCR